MFDTRLVSVIFAVFSITYYGSAIPLDNNICLVEGVNPLDDYLPDASNCSRFFKCDHGEPVLFECPSILHFSASLKQCDWPENARCNQTSVDLPNQDAPCQDYGLPECPEHEPNKPAVHLPHPSDCTKFYECDWGVPYLLFCPGGLHFNAGLQVCDYPERAGCVCQTNQNITSTSVPPLA